MAASKPSISERLVERYASSRLGDFMSALRSGWNAYSFIFYIGGISAILGGIFGWAGWASAIVTLLFFYYAGKFKEKVDLHMKRKKAEDKRKTTPRTKRQRVSSRL
jgi:hypothetical protein